MQTKKQIKELPEQINCRTFKHSITYPVIITEKDKLRNSVCWDGLFFRSQDKNLNSYSCYIKLINGQVNYNLEDFVILKNLLDRLKDICSYSKTVDEDGFIEITTKTIAQRILVLRTIRCLYGATGRKFIQDAMDYSSSKRKNFIYCLFFISRYNSILNMCRPELLINGKVHSRSFFPDSRGYETYYNIKSKVLKLSRIWFYRGNTKKEILKILSVNTNIYHVDTKNSISHFSLLEYEVAQKNNSIFFALNKEFWEIKKYDIAAFEKIYQKDRKESIKLKN